MSRNNRTEVVGIGVFACIRTRSFSAESTKRGRPATTRLAEVLAEEVVWHVPGRNAIAGDYREIDRVMAYVPLRRELAEGAFEITAHDVAERRARAHHRNRTGHPRGNGL